MRKVGRIISSSKRMQDEKDSKIKKQVRNL
jgi:hypothetical protein